MAREKWSIEKLQQAANQFANRTEFARGNAAAYSTAARWKVLDQICGHMIAKQAARYTDDDLAASAKEYMHVSDWRKAEPSKYQAAHSRGIVKEICAHMTRKKVKFPDRAPNALKWADERLREVASGYTDRTLFRKEQFKAYDSARSRGLLEQICAHMEVTRPSRMTTEWYKQQLPETLELLEPVVNATTKVLHRCKACSHEWRIMPATIRSGKGCPICAWEAAKKKLSEVRRYTPEEYASRVPHLTVVGEYQGVHVYIEHKCNGCGKQRMMRPFTALLAYDCPYCVGHGTSKGEMLIADYIESLGFDVERNTRRVISPKELDVYVPSAKLAIEFNGSYWHSLHPDDYHLNKTLACDASGIRLIHVWEHEKNNPIMKSIISAALGSFERTIYARKCTIERLTWAETSAFLNENHIQGAGAPTPENIGLKCDGELVAVMTFAKPRFGPVKQDWELVRFASSIGTKVVGGAGKLWNKRPSGTIITYSDRRLFTGELYERLGFTKVNESKPGYFYVNAEGDTVSRFKAQKHRLPDLLGDKFNPEMTELENMKVNRWMKISDCGAVRWVYDPS